MSRKERSKSSRIASTTSASVASILMVLILSFGAFGQNALPTPVPKIQFFNNTGQPLAGGFVYTYAAGTTNALASYTDSTGNVPNANPVVLDAGGFANIWLLSSQCYKIVVQNSAHVQASSTDNICAPLNAASLAVILASPPPIGNVIPNVVWTSDLVTAAPEYDVRIAGAKCDWNGSTGTNDTVALQNTINLAQTAARTSPAVVRIPTGAQCYFTTGLTVKGNVVFRGSHSKVHADSAGSGLVYGGTGDAITVEDTNTSNFTYFVSFEHLYIGATAAATSLIHEYNNEGPSHLDDVTLDGGQLAHEGLICHNCQFQWELNNVWAHGFTQHAFDFSAGGPIKADLLQVYDIGQDATGVTGSGILLSGVNTFSLTNSYTELMPVGIEIVNNDENYGFYIFEHDYLNNWGSGTAPGTNTANQRCIKVHSTNDSLPMLTQGRIVDVTCHMGPVFTQGLSPYAFDFDVVSNSFRTINNWTFKDSQVSGMTTAALYSDSASVTVHYGTNVNTTIYDVGSSAPVYLPDTAGSGLYYQNVLADQNGTAFLSATCTAADATPCGSHLFDFKSIYYDGAAWSNGDWTIGSSEAAGTNPPGQLGFYYSGSSGNHVVVFPQIGTEAVNPAAGGFIHMANTETLNWRNFANGGDDYLGVNTSDQLTFNGVAVGGGGGLPDPTGHATQFLWTPTGTPGDEAWSTPAGGGNVTGPGSSTINHIAGFADGTGTLLLDLGAQPTIPTIANTSNLLKGDGFGNASAYSGGTSCTNQFVTSFSSTGAVTCTSATLAGAQFANQGTTAQVLHGNASGNPSWSSTGLLPSGTQGYILGYGSGATPAAVYTPVYYAQTLATFVADDATDNLAAFNTAMGIINNANAGSGILVLPTGITKITSGPLVIPNNVIIAGSGGTNWVIGTTGTFSSSLHITYDNGSTPDTQCLGTATGPVGGFCGFQNIKVYNDNNATPIGPLYTCGGPWLDNILLQGKTSAASGTPVNDGVYFGLPAATSGSCGITNARFQGYITNHIQGISCKNIRQCMVFNQSANGLHVNGIQGDYSDGDTAGGFIKFLGSSANATYDNSIRSMGIEMSNFGTGACNYKYGIDLPANAYAQGNYFEFGVSDLGKCIPSDPGTLGGSAFDLADNTSSGNEVHIMVGFWGSGVPSYTDGGTFGKNLFFDNPQNSMSMKQYYGTSLGTEATLAPQLGFDYLYLNSTGGVCIDKGSAPYTCTTFMSRVSAGILGIGTTKSSGAVDGSYEATNFIAVGPSANSTLASAATSANTIKLPATVPTTGHGLYCATSSTTCTLTDTGYVYNAIPLADLATQAADTVMMNATGGSATPTAISLDSLGGTNSCGGSADALTFNSSTHAWGCNTISGSGTVNSGTQYHLGYYATSTTAISDMGADMTFGGTAHTLLGGASLLVNWASASSFKPPGGGGTLSLGSANQNWATLGTGIVKNTTTTGALSDAASTDIIGVFSGGDGCTGVHLLAADGTCRAAGAGTVTTTGSPATGNISYFSGSTSIIGTANATLDSSGNAGFAGTVTDSLAPGASTSALLFTGTPYSGGTGTTTKPLLHMVPTGASTSSSWNTAGTFLGVNAQTGFSGNFIDFHLNGGTSLFKVDYQGNLTAVGNATFGSAASTASIGMNTTGGNNSLTTAASEASRTWTLPSTTTILLGETATDNTTTHVLHATATNGVGTFSAIATGDLPTIPLAGGGTNADLSAGGSSTCNATGLGVLKQNSSHVVSSACIGAVDLPAALSSSTSVNGLSLSSTVVGGVTIGDIITYHTPATGIARTTASSQAIAGSELSGVVTTSGSNVTSYAIANTTFTVSNATFNANTCVKLDGTAGSSTVTMTGTATTSVFFMNMQGDTSAVPGFGTAGGLVILPWPTTNTLNLKVCNQTASNITTGTTVTVNVGAR